MGRWIEHWQPEDEGFWQRQGRAVARRNLAFSMVTEFLGFSVWMVWSVTAAKLDQAGFDFSTGQLFTLVSVPALVGATARFPYTFAVARFGGRNWTVVSALLLLVPTAVLPLLVSNPATPYWAFLLGAATAGLGGGNFASSMANISFFYPDRHKGLALGLNAAGGNLGVAGVQLLVPVAVTTGSLAVVGGAQGGGSLFLQNAGLIWVPFIVAAALCAGRFMDNLRVSQAPLRQQAVVVKRKHTWVMSWLYIGTFGSFIGYSAGLPLLIATQFPDVKVGIAFLGPLVGSLSRPLGGWLADRVGGARVTLATFAAMVPAVLGVAFFLNRGSDPDAFVGFLAGFVALFVLTGIGNGSTYRMVPMIFRAHHAATAQGRGRQGDETALRETASALGFISAVGAYGGWLIPQAYGLSTSLTGEPRAALYGFLGFYLSCIALTWWHYLRTSFALRRAPSLAWAKV
ncbi:MAG: MFS transporter [Actinomycetota bacterium]|nr:MFS transporter [Actinomycetota bacterium]